MKIIMTLAGLDIGGAETHVVELSKELKRRGHDVVMISGGGVYVKEVEDFGIKHYVVPIKVRDVKKILVAKKIMKKIVLEEKPDIVHAHARIPGFIMGQIHKELPGFFVYVTTAHWTFDTSFVVKNLTCWGSKTLAVSEDIKKYLLKYYNVKEENIFISINGIDSGKFNKDVSGERIIKEFNLNPQSPRIVYVSRLNPAVCAPAFKIIENISKIDKAVPGVEVVIVGDGDSYAEMLSKANKANEILGRRAIILAGARTDINEIHATADVCVGVSRAILEPMSMEKKCVIAGQEGYIGILNEDKLNMAIDCNFTCRGCTPLDGNVLTKDIIKLFETDEEENKRITDYGKSVVEKYYSVKTMADDNLNMYHCALRDLRHDVVMLGYYGYENRGDDALLGAILKDMRSIDEDFSPVVLSNLPEKTSRMYGVKSIDRFNIFKIRKAFKNAKMFLAGGGSLIQDVTSTKSILYYLYIIKLAKNMGLKVMLYANGIGPINKRYNVRKAKKILDLADVITLRDEESRKLLQKIGVTKPAICVTADPAFGIENSKGSEIGQIEKKYNLPKKYVSVSVRNFSNISLDFAPQFAKMIDYMCQKYNTTAVFVAMQYLSDKEISKTVSNLMKEKSIFIDRPLDVDEIMQILANSEAVVAVRLHMLIFGSALGVPVFGINYDPKVESFQKSLGSEFCLGTEQILNGEYTETVDRFMQNLDQIAENTKKVAEVMKYKAVQNAVIANKLLKSNTSEEING